MYRIIVWYNTANIVSISVFNALSIGRGLVAAVKLCMKREVSEDRISALLENIIFVIGQSYLKE